jgi:hypothetical protein
VSRRAATARYSALVMPLRRLLLRAVAAVAVGAGVGAAALLGTSSPTPAASRAECYTRLRLLRHAVAAFTAQHGHLPGRDAMPDGGQAAGQLADQLTQPRDARGRPSARGPFPGLLDAIPFNPFTGSRELAIVPEGADPIAFAAASRAGWAYVAAPARDALGPLPAGLVLPCGAAPEPGGRPPAQDLGFEIEDYLRWR